MGKWEVKSQEKHLSLVWGHYKVQRNGERPPNRSYYITHNARAQTGWAVPPCDAKEVHSAGVKSEG